MNTSIRVIDTLQEMEQKRLELQEFALAHGFLHPTTLRLSRELDEIFNHYSSLH
ncbi:Spo0E family sporulation regulatory protein-aspartic acid phosphatase [Rossellomorea sp. DUT-2]|uniref:Spo0E family sporulation regulatory protein-aspartic acid phosphatase n=1 Tax=Rossellomorea sp. DUT-2 TaxID=3412021 RepID=UPI003D183868